MEEESGGGEGMFFGVYGIAQNGCADVLEMDADLVGASGVEVAEDESGFGRVIGRDDFVIGDGGFASGWIDHSHFLPIHRMSPDVGEDRIFGFGRNAVGDGEVDFFHAAALGKLGGKALVGRVGFRDDQTAGSIFIEAVNNTGTLHSADAGELAFAMMEQGVDQSAVGISGGGMDDHSVLFVEHDEVLVFENDVQGNVLRSCHIRNGFRDDDGNRIACLDAVPGFGGFFVEQDVLLADQGLDS